MSIAKAAAGKETLIQEVKFQNYFKGKNWEDLNRQFFDGLAPKYDRLNEVLSFGQHRAIKEKSIRRLPVRDGAKTLDLCTGSGDIALMLSRQCPGAHVTALDASSEMLTIARQKAEAITNIDFVQGDALKTGFADESFDGVFIGFGLRNLTDIDNGLAEMIRLIRPGGWVSVLDLGKPDGWIRRHLYALYFENVMPFLGKNIFHRGEFNSFEYLPKSNRHFPPPGEIADRMTRLGLEDVQVYDYLLGGISQQLGRKPEKGAHS